MTRLGQMMYQDGVEAGIAQGMERGAETAKITIAQNLVGLLADEFISEHVGLPLETVKALHNE